MQWTVELLVGAEFIVGNRIDVVRCQSGAEAGAGHRRHARLLQEAPKRTWPHYYAASLFFLQNRHEMALRAARNAVAIDPDNAKAHNLIGAALASMGQRDAARAA